MKLRFYSIFLFLLTFLACAESQKKQNNKNQNDYSKKEKSTQQSDNSQNGDVPSKAYTVLKYIRANGKAMPDYVGGRNFQNREKRLPLQETGKKIRYQEWDVNPKERGRNRGAERLITSPDKAYYTSDHYKTFTQMKE